MNELNRDKLFREMDPGNLFKEITRLENELKLTKEERDRARRNNTVEIVKDISKKILIGSCVFGFVYFCGWAITKLTIDNTSGQHARNVTTWTARTYMRSQYPNQFYDLYCAPNITMANNVFPCGGMIHYIPCHINLTSQNRRFIICCDSDEAGSNTGCDGNERFIRSNSTTSILNR
jgi:hypothetical protein